MRGKMLKLIRKVYSKVTAAERTQEGLTEFFDCKLGVRQGCMLSPRLSLEKYFKNPDIEALQWIMHHCNRSIPYVCR